MDRSSSSNRPTTQYQDAGATAKPQGQPGVFPVDTRVYSRINIIAGDVSNALEALKSNPDSPEAVATLRKSADRLGAEKTWNDAAEVYETALRTARRGNAETELLTALGTVYWRRLDNIERAEGCFRK